MSYDQFTDFGLRHDPTDFDHLAEISQSLPSARADTPETIEIQTLKALGLDQNDPIAAFVRNGDDVEHSIGSDQARFKSRSEVRWFVATHLAGRGFDELQIAGLLLNSAYGISQSVLEKRNAKKVAYREAAKAVASASAAPPELYKNGQPKPGFRNALWALYKLGLTFSFDMFHNRKQVNGHMAQQFQGDPTDDISAAIRKKIVDQFGFDPGKGHVLDAIQTLCIENAYHPIHGYLDDVDWDGVPRLETWLINYLGAEDTPLNRAIGKLTLVAAVRRVRQPGCKFDTVVVLEGPQGTGKSTALRILAGDDNFSDQDLIGLDQKTQAELLEGVWLYEIAELSGLRKADVTHAKSFFSRQVDQIRPAYGRFKERWPRQCIFVGTTNDDDYLKDVTGNRRFLPVKTTQIDLESIARDRDQLWAEAAQLEADDFPITLPPEMWAAAAEAQKARMPDDPWLDTLANVEGTIVGGEERIATADLFGENYLNIGAGRIKDYDYKHASRVMQQLGWTKAESTIKINGKAVRGYFRDTGAKDGSGHEF